jgi:hypothetical protein
MGNSSIAGILPDASGNIRREQTIRKAMLMSMVFVLRPVADVMLPMTIGNAVYTAVLRLIGLTIEEREAYGWRCTRHRAKTGTGS